jgi:phosphatidylserine synthase
MMDFLAWDRWCTSFYLLLLAATAFLEVGLRLFKVGDWVQRRPYYLSALVMMFISASGVSSLGFRSMGRYTFPVHVCWLLGIAPLIQKIPPQKHWIKRWLLLLAIVLGIYTLLLQSRMIEAFTHFQWVG